MASGSFLDKSSLNLFLQAAKHLSWAEGDELGGEITDFLTQMHSSLDPSSLDLFRLDDLAAMAETFWTWTGTRGDDETLIRIRQAEAKDGSPLEYSVLELCVKDMPFIVRSVSGACLELNLNPFLVLHPMMDVDRDGSGLRTSASGKMRESYVQIYLNHLDDATAAGLEEEARLTIADIKASVQDFMAMKKRMRHCAIDVLSLEDVDKDTMQEAADFLNWLADDHFTFLGSREHRFHLDENGAITDEPPELLHDSGLGLLKDPNRYILKSGHEPITITSEISDFLSQAEPIIVSKGSVTSRVHRRVKYDYIGVKQYDDQGRMIGEIRFAGLFTADAYNRMTRDVPLLRKKAADVIARTGRAPGSHDASALKNILETYPRDELFQISDDELYEISLAILQLQTRNETRLFVRTDKFDRFISALVYIPKEAFGSSLRAQIADLLSEAYDGELTAFYPFYGDAPMSRILFLIDLKPDHKTPDTVKLEEQIAKLARGWDEDMTKLLGTHPVNITPRPKIEDISRAFGPAYREGFSPEEALSDLDIIAELDANNPVRMRAYRLEDDEPDIIRAKIYTVTNPVELSNCVPVFEDMGLFVSSERGFSVKFNRDQEYWIHALSMRIRNKTRAIDEIKAQFEAAFEAIWTDKTVSDRFNQLVLSIGSTWREAALFRALARYRKQTGMDPGQTIQIQALINNPEITKQLLELFKTRFDPDLEQSLDKRREAGGKVFDDIIQKLEDVPSLDEDRVLRRIANLVQAITRTSFYQRDDEGTPLPHIAFKIASRDLDVLPEPRPYREIFVWAPHVEGVHLRFGPVARGGLRWSDRQDDFRTEILGLVKAQQVKNAVIVPVGSKGGFFPKNLPTNGDQQAVRAEGIRAYKTFILAMLQLTDNIMDGKTLTPKRTIIWDDQDPYLVVAADKGTASFSDIANEISTSHGFWLGDAFASGGSAGYDHKKMGITARGAWVAVQRHFREMGINTQEDPVSVIGVGDMSGDVFGNGMLLSKTINLKAAFNHLHIFIDPNPGNAAAAWEERKRIFDLPRSTWEDYDKTLISEGGGIFSRAAKKIELTPQIKAFINTEADHLTPNELIKLILKAEADLMWFGGIGTYIKSKEESDLDVGDKANDLIRIDARELNVKVIGEGANLGATQAGRIAFAKMGGRINTDAIDNSAGVDSSDHEVNIKILLKNAIEAGDLPDPDRNDLLASMTDEVADLVLAHNYDQTGALTVAQASAASDLDSHERLMERLETAGILDRDVEGLPRTEDIRALRESGKGLTRPELSVLLAYAKNRLFDEIVASDVPDDPYLNDNLVAYFPEPVHRFENAMNAHRLKREIIATRLANDIVNLGGITFVHRVKERAGTETGPIVRAFIAAKDIFGLTPLLTRIDELDNRVDARVQTDLRVKIINALRRQVFWLGKTRPANVSINDLVTQYQPGVEQLKDIGLDNLSPFEKDNLTASAKALSDRGTPEALALDVSALATLSSGTDIVDLATKLDKDVVEMSHIFNAVGANFQFDRLRHSALGLSLDEHWDRLAVRGIIETFLGQQHALAERIMSEGGKAISNYKTAETVVSAHIEANSENFAQLKALQTDIERAGGWSFAKLVLIANAMRGYIEETAS